MMNAKTRVGLFLCAFFNQLANAQPEVLLSTLVEHASVVDTRANQPLSIFSMRIPFRISAIASNHEISFDYHAGNIFNPSGVLEYPTESEPYYANPWDATYRPSYKEAPQRYQLYSVDGVIRNAHLSYTRKISKQIELYTSINSNMLVGGGSVMDALVSDEIIEGFDKLIGQHNDYRILNGFNLTEMKFTDREGRTLEVKPRQIFMGTIDIGYRHFLELIRNPKSNFLWTMNIAAQVGVPLNRAREHLSAGTIIGMAITKKVTKKYGITLAVAYTIQHDKILSIRQAYFDFNYADVVSGYRFLLGQNFDFDNHKRFTFGIEMQGATAPLSTQARVLAYLNPEDIGIKTNYIPEYWTLENPIALTNQRRSSRGLISGGEFVSLNFSYRFGKPNRASTITFYVQDDWTIKLLLSSELNNAENFGAGIKWTKVIP